MTNLSQEQLRARHDALLDSSVLHDLCLGVAEEFDQLARPDAGAPERRPLEKADRANPWRSAAQRALGFFWVWRRPAGR